MRAQSVEINALVEINRANRATKVNCRSRTYPRTFICSVSNFYRVASRKKSTPRQEKSLVSTRFLRSFVVDPTICTLHLVIWPGPSVYNSL